MSCSRQAGLLFVAHDRDQSSYLEYEWQLFVAQNAAKNCMKEAATRSRPSVVDVAPSITMK